jgi:multicomponent Na+:H+ antiporter subunit G
VFFCISALGVVRFPDLYTRMHAATNGGAFGAVLMLLGAAVYFFDWRVTTVALLIVFFIFLTAPVAGHMIGRAAHKTGTPQWPGTRIDEWKQRMEERRDSRDNDC